MTIVKSYNSDRAAANERVYPPRTSDRYYIATELRKQIEKTIVFLLNYGEGRRLVDFGCADMPYRGHFEAAGFEYIGADLPGNQMAEEVIQENGRTSLADGTADVVLSTQVLEHVTDPNSYLIECARLLRPGGLLVLSTHGYWMYHPDPTDYWRWTSEGLRKTITSAGFEVLNVEGILGLAAVGAQLFNDGWYPKLPRRLRTAFAVIMQFVVAFSDRLHSSQSRALDASIFITVSKRL